MHVELIAPGLLAPQDAPRLPALELLLARGRSSAIDAQGLHAWLGEAVGLTPLPAGALTAAAEGFWVRADPVHLRLMRDRLLLVPVTGLQRAQAEALAGTLNRHFAGLHEFRVEHPDCWVMRTAPAELATLPAAEMAGRDVDPQLPGGKWPALLNEIQMALHEHPVNEGRELPVNSVWLWGPGALPAAVESRWRSVTAEEPAARGLARIAAISHRAPPRSAPAWLDELPEDGRHLLILAAPAQELEQAWFAPLLAALKGGRIGLLSILVPDAGLEVEVSRSDLRRFWRRLRPLAAHAHR